MPLKYTHFKIHAPPAYQNINSWNLKCIFVRRQIEIANDKLDTLRSGKHDIDNKLKYTINPHQQEQMVDRLAEFTNTSES